MSDMPKTREELESALLAIKECTADELANRVEDGGYLFSDKVAVEELTLPDLPEGWKLHSTTPHKLELPRIIFIAATTSQTRLIWDRGQVAIARKAGLSEGAILRWLKCNSKHKYRFLDHLKNCEAIPGTKDAYLAYDVSFTDPQYREWVNTYSVRDRLSPAARSLLVELIKDIIQ